MDKTLYTQTVETIKSLSENADSSKWSIGDLLVSLTVDLKKSQLKPLLLEISKDTNLDFDTLYQYRWVSKKFETTDRDVSPVLTYTHYRVVSSLEDPKPWLEKAADNLWTTQRLKEEIASEKAAKNEDGLPCALSICKNSLSPNLKERVFVSIYGTKFTCCSIACANNIILNNANQIQYFIQGKDIPGETSNTFLITNPNPSIKQEEKEWYLERSSKEKEFISKKYGKNA